LRLLGLGTFWYFGNYFKTVYMKRTVASTGDVGVEE